MVPCWKPRAQHLLKTLIERYIADGQPVGSRALSRHSGLELSPATIRNVMADLEEMGFITSPHTSAGRVPTAKGYRFFVDSLMVLKPLEHTEIQRLEEELTADRPQQLDERRRGTAVAAHPLRRRGDDAEAARGGVPPSRVPAPVRAPRAADPRDPRRRRAEPHPAHRPRATRRRSLPRRRTSSTSNFAGQPFATIRARIATSCGRCARTSPAS